MKRMFSLLAVLLSVYATGCADSTGQTIAVTNTPDKDVPRPDLEDVVEEYEQRFENSEPVLIEEVTETTVINGYTYGEWETVRTFKSPTPVETTATDTTRIMADGYEYISEGDGYVIMYKYVEQVRTKTPDYTTISIGTADNGERVIIRE